MVTVYTENQHKYAQKQTMITVITVILQLNEIYRNNAHTHAYIHAYTHIRARELHRLLLSPQKNTRKGIHEMTTRDIAALAAILMWLTFLYRITR